MKFSLGGTAENAELYSRLQNHPKRLTNPTWKATVRRTLQENAKQLDLGLWSKEEKVEGFDNDESTLKTYT
jgi:hypothetical protein